MKLCATCKVLWRQEHSRKVKAGLELARARGTRIGRRPLEDPALLVTVARLRERGYSIREIAQALQVSKTWVWKAVQACT